MKYALALAGGGTRGAFEAGVWKALCQMNIEVNAICGTSVGAINGAVFAGGRDAAALWENITAKDIVDSPPEGDNLLSVPALLSLAKGGAKGRYNTDRLRRTLTEHIDEDVIRDSGIDLGVCAYLPEKKKAAELYIEDIPKGKLIDYVIASSCFPIFKPIRIDGNEFTDGAMVNNLPVNMLLERGCRTVISVSVKGIGRVRDFDRCGANIIEVNIDEPEVGMMDFNRDSIKRSIDAGYLECMRVFGRLVGEYYYIEPRSYLDAVSVFGREFIGNVERAAKMAGCDRCRTYTADELTRAVCASYRNSTRLRRLVEIIERAQSGFIRKKLDLLGDDFSAANAVVYLRNSL